MRESLGRRPEQSPLDLEPPTRVRLPPLESEVVCAYSAVQLTGQARCRPADCESALRHATAQLSQSNLQALMRILKYCGSVDPSPILELAATVYDLIPGTIAADPTQDAELSRFFFDAEIECAARGDLEPFTRPQPAVDAWVGSLAGFVCEALAESAAMRTGQGAALADLCGAALLLICRQFPSFEKASDNAPWRPNDRRFSFGDDLMFDVVTSVLGSMVCETISKLDDKAQQQFVHRAKQLARQELKLWHAKDQPLLLLAALQAVKGMSEYLANAAERAVAFYQVRRLPELLDQQHPALNRETTGPVVEAMPVGEVVISLGHGLQGFFAKYDGRHGLLCAGMARNDASMIMPFTYFDTDAGALNVGRIDHATGAYLDLNGKMFPSPFERFMPAAPAWSADWYDRSAAAVRRISAAVEPVLKEAWELHPVLFSSIANTRPILLLADGEDLRLIVAEKGFPPIQNLEPVRLTGVEALAGYLFPSGWEARRLNEVHMEPEPDVPLDSPEELSAWQQIYRRLPNGKLSFEWLMKKLKPFRVEVVPEEGKGSHYKLHRHAPDGEHTYPVSDRFRDEVNKASQLKKVLRGIGLSLEEFALGLG